MVMVRAMVTAMVQVLLAAQRSAARRTALALAGVRESDRARRARSRHGRRGSVALADRAEARRGAAQRSGARLEEVATTAPATTATTPQPRHTGCYINPSWPCVDCPSPTPTITPPT